MATKKKTFDAVAASRRWRRTTSRLLNKMTPAEQIAFLNRRVEKRAADSAAKTGRELAHR
jgi:hypothetical protein